jgi:hypothetical protein
MYITTKNYFAYYDARLLSARKGVERPEVLSLKAPTQGERKLNENN